ncbi:MAG TPA: DUF4019 domain-containing protein [Rhodanobacteraceae bacterium]|nr:DUF4019 domain-containing protein [Rhodanobacteraceae bacterium]
MRSSFVLALAMLFCVSSPIRADSLTTTEAVAASRAWLAVVDAGEYTKSWDGAAALFKQRVTKAEWEQAVAKVRDGTGAMKTRELESAQPEHTLPGVPDGDYVVMTYRSAFEKYPTATETVAAMRDPDGQWRVAGYFVK